MKRWALPYRDQPDQDAGGFDPLLTSLMRIQIGFDPSNVSLRQPEICERVLILYNYLICH
jgi:hypothetical protein